MQGRILPSSESALTLHAVFKDKTEIVGESRIADYSGTIDHVYVTNTCNEEQPTASRHVVNAIMTADMIVMGPVVSSRQFYQMSSFQKFERHL